MAAGVLCAAALLLVTSTGAFSFLNDQEALLAVELAESDYVDMCPDHANATWAWLLNPSRHNLKLKLQADEDLAQAQRSNSDSLREFSEPASLEDAGLRERVLLASSPGAAALPLPDYRKVVQFAARSLNVTRSQSIPCYNDSLPCRWDWHKSGRVLASSHDPYRAHHAWLQWHHLFAPQAADFHGQLELLQRAAEGNGANDIWEYWELMTDYPETGKNASSLWAGELQRLYGDLRQFVLARLRFQYGPDMVGDDDLLPLHLLGSFVGDDWLRIADLVTPPFDEAYKNLSNSLRKKSWKGQHLYGVAAGVGSKMGLPSLKKSLFWENAHFNGSCPAAVLPWCTENYVRIQTCDKVDVHSYLDAHRVTMHALFHQLSVHNGRYILRQLNRHSALLEAVMGLGELLAVSHQQLTRLGLLAEAATDSDSGTGAGPDAQLRLLVALHTLPRLAHALATDVWRAEGVNSTWNGVSSTIRGVRPPRDVAESWEYVQDKKVALNQPYLGTAAGIILQFQLFEKLLNDNIHDPQNPVDIIKKDGLLRKVMVAGLSAPWLDVVNQVMGITELDVKPLLRYFEPIRSLLLSDVAPDTPRLAKFERQALPPDVAEEKPTELSAVTEADTSSTTQAVSSRSQEVEGTAKPEGDSPKSGPLPGTEPKPDNAAGSQAILIGSLSLIGIGLGTGAILAGRHFYRKKKQRERRNRRPT
ncbi:angiotensin-converting enzyme-like [Schistocerca nitens]|uniref:angiotensin-converting enzyme-like n=1 Tax=Schistocerca nitens TaxID=7011 RepID=UPI00211900D0|nr:angiotensin-converting enzyme-like [Schistocerca nitens]